MHWLLTRNFTGWDDCSDDSLSWEPSWCCQDIVDLWCISLCNRPGVLFISMLLIALLFFHTSCVVCYGASVHATDQVCYSMHSWIWSSIVLHGVWLLYCISFGMCYSWPPREECAPRLVLFPGLPCFLFFGLRSVKYMFVVLRFAFSIIHGSVYYTEPKLKNKNGGGLGTRLRLGNKSMTTIHECMLKNWASWIYMYRD